MMKYGLIIQDMTADEVLATLEKIEAGSLMVDRVTVTEERRDEILSTDIEGLQWDERIHSGSRAKNKDGTWKRKKNLTEEEYKAVHDEIKPKPAFTPDVILAPAHLLPPVSPVEIVSYGTAGGPGSTATVGGSGGMGSTATVGGSGGQSHMPPTAPAPMPAAPAPIEAAPAVIPAPLAPARDYQGFMLQLSRLFATQRIKPEYPQTVLGRVNSGFKTNLVTITDIANDPNMVEYAWQCLDVDKMGV